MERGGVVKGGEMLVNLTLFYLIESKILFCRQSRV